MIATVHPDDRRRIAHVMADRLQGKKFAAENEFRILRKDGEIRWVLTHGSLISYRGTPAIQITYFDITDRKQAEQALLESEARLRQITETLTSVFYVHERVSNRFIYVSPAYEKIWKRSRQSLYDDPYTYLEAVHPYDKPRLLESIRMELEGSGYVDTDYRIMQPDGTIRWIHSKNYPVFDAQGNVYRVAGTAEDITSRRAAEDALKESEDRYRKLVEISPNAVLLHRDGKVIYANRALARILGTEDADDFLGKNVLDLIHPAYREAIQTNIAQDLTGAPTPFMELQMIRADGSPVFVEGQGVGTTIDGKPAVLVAINDITGRYRAGQALKESEERYRNLAEASQDLIFVISRDDRVEYVNSYAAAMLGLHPDQVIGKKRSSLFTGETGERQGLGLRRVFETGITWRSEGPLKVSGTIRWFDHLLMPITDAQGTVTSVMGVSRDITDRRQDGNNLYQGEH
jgi:PAS domain S-box-containing protein